MPVYYLIYLIDCFLKAVGLVPELASDVDVGCLGPHCESNHKCSFYQFMGVTPHDLSVFACAWFGLVGVND